MVHHYISGRFTTHIIHTWSSSFSNRFCRRRQRIIATVLRTWYSWLSCIMMSLVWSSLVEDVVLISLPLLMISYRIGQPHFEVGCYEMISSFQTDHLHFVGAWEAECLPWLVSSTKRLSFIFSYVTDPTWNIHWIQTNMLPHVDQSDSLRYCIM